MNRKITDNMDIYEVYEVMCEGNELAEDIITELLRTTNDIDMNFEQLVALDKRNIRGNKMVKLFEYCCDCNIDKFYLTILALRFNNIYTDKEIADNLKFAKPIPFIQDKDVNYDYLKPINRIEFYKRVLDNKEYVIEAINNKRRKKRILVKDNI